MAHLEVTAIWYDTRSQLRQWVIGFSPQRARFHPRAVYVVSVVDKGELGVSLSTSVFLSTILLLLHIHSPII